MQKLAAPLAMWEKMQSESSPGQIKSAKKVIKDQEQKMVEKLESKKAT